MPNQNPHRIVEHWHTLPLSIRKQIRIDIRACFYNCVTVVKSQLAQFHEVKFIIIDSKFVFSCRLEDYILLELRSKLTFQLTCKERGDDFAFANEGSS